MNSNYALVLFIAGTMLLIMFAFFFILYLQVQKRKQNRFRWQKEQLEFAYKSEILKTGLEVQQHALDKISGELHDNIGGRLTAVMRNLIAANTPVPVETADMLRTQAVSLLEEVIKDARSISHTLNSQYVITKGLVASVKKEVDYICKATGMHCDVLVTGDYYSLDDEKELIVFRMVQESIANVVKHAGATCMDVKMHYEPEHFTVTITDNGKGFNTTAPAGESSGIGLMNMQNRARFINGTLHIRSASGSGTEVILSVNTLPPNEKGKKV